MNRPPWKKWLPPGAVLLAAGLLAYWGLHRGPELSSASFTKFSRNPGKALPTDQWRVVLGGDLSGTSEVKRDCGTTVRHQSWLVENVKAPDPATVLERLKEVADVRVTSSELQEKLLVVEYTGRRPLIGGRVTYDFQETPEGHLAVQCRLEEKIGSP